MAWYRWQGDDLELSLRVQPRASRDGFGDIEGEVRKLRLKAAPVDGKANAELMRYLAKAFGVPRARVSLLVGERSRNKRVRVVAPRKLPPELCLERPRR